MLSWEEFNKLFRFAHDNVTDESIKEAIAGAWREGDRNKDKMMNMKEFMRLVAIKEMSEQVG